MIKYMTQFFGCLLLVTLVNYQAFSQAPKVPVYEVHELVFRGKDYKAQDVPAVEVEFTTTWRHESGSPTYTIHGFYDGNGKGGVAGDVFKVRFCPTRPGKWTLEETVSNDKKLNGQHKGYAINGTPSSHKGFWQADEQSAGQRWYRRSDGSHAYIVGDTLYSFLSEHLKGKPTGSYHCRRCAQNCAAFQEAAFCRYGRHFSAPQRKTVS